MKSDEWIINGEESLVSTETMLEGWGGMSAEDTSHFGEDNSI